MFKRKLPIFAERIYKLTLHIRMKRLNIHIHELGPVRNAKIELAPVMIFTGASNLGKSYTNFLAF